MKPVLPMNRLCLLFIILFSSNAFGQEVEKRIQKEKIRLETDRRISRVSISKETGKPSFIYLSGNGSSTDQSMTMLSDFFQLRPGIDQMIPADRVRLPREMATLNFRQYFKGRKVEHGIFRAFIKGDRLKFMNGEFYDIPDGFSVTPVISEEAALTYAKKRMPAKLYAWEDLENQIDDQKNEAYKTALKSQLADYIPKGEIVIVKDFNVDGEIQPRLAYKFNIYAADPLGRAWIYVDAENGRILLKDDIIKHVGNPGKPSSTSVSAVVQTRYAGTQSIKTKQISGNDPNSNLLLTASNPLELYVPGALTYALIDDTRGNGIETYDLNGVGGVPLNIGALYLQGKSFTDIDNNWTLAEHHRSPTNGGAAELQNDDIAWDAHWGAEVVYDYWLDKHGRRSYDGNDAKIKSFIHYGPAYDNAFWNGEAMTYGDGLLYKSLISLDVCGHEIGHGICEFTSDLVYQKESGAMNEGFSDIWAACIEHYAMRRSGSTVPSSAYRPFYVGEQIAANPNTPLRRMDNPKARTDPDTYGGQYWANPDCIPEQNSNDNCGVHTNSGVLNHWFFLLTAGSRSGTRPAGMTANQYYFADSDDEINDLGNSYIVNGVGFDVSEQVAFVTETLLSANATYAEAREVSISVATELSGNPCGSLVESVTNAWYAVGVGTAFDAACATTYGFFGQNSVTVNEAANPAGCNSQKTINLPVILPANSTAGISVSGSATAGEDFSVPSAITNNNSVTDKVYLTVTIKNDAVIENNESLQLSVAISNTGNSAVNTVLNLTITDDDVVPVIGSGSRTLLSESFTLPDGSPGPSGWVTVADIADDVSDPSAFKGHNYWQVAGGQLVITGKEPLTGVALPAGNYYNNSESRSYIQTPLIDATGLSLLNLSFDYRVQGEVDPQKINIGEPDIDKLPVFDYMSVMFSLDGINWTEMTSGDFKKFASALPATGSFTGRLPAAVANKKFYIAFKWYNDTNAGGPESVNIDNVHLTGSPRTPENDPGHNSRETLNAGNDIYFYSIQDGQVITRIQNNSASRTYGCTNTYIEKTGNGAFNLYQGRDGIHKVSEKIIRVEPALSFKGSSVITLYFSEEQVSSLEAATGYSRNDFQVYQVAAANYMLAANNNTKRFTPVVNSANGVVSFTLTTGNDYIHGSYALGIPVTLFLTQKALKQPDDDPGMFKFSRVYPNPVKNRISIDVTAPQNDRLYIEVINSLGQVVRSNQVVVFVGKQNIGVDISGLKAGSYMIRTRSEDGVLLDSQSIVK
jgi:Zn-dependent metalloprotease